MRCLKHKCCLSEALWSTNVDQTLLLGKILDKFVYLDSSSSEVKPLHVHHVI